MDIDDPRQPLLGTPRRPSADSSPCGVASWRRRLPFTAWLPKYRLNNLVRDSIAGLTVGLTSIPQGIAYALVAGLPPQVGLYSSIFPGIVYAVFGSCKDVTVGPTAILAALLAKYVAQSEDFAYLASFLTGCFIFLLGVLQLGFLLDLISKPVIAGFTTAAALQIAASQLKSLFRVTGASGGTCISSLINFFRHVGTANAADGTLGCVGVTLLLAAKYISVPVNTGSSRARVICASACRHFVRARNAILVAVAAALAYILHLYGRDPFALTGEIKGGLPNFKPPPFTTTVGNKTLDFSEMLTTFGPEGLVMPLVAIMESIAIAKAFAGSASVDGTQEMIAVGLCNVVASFCQAMPATGSFTRTALNNASGVTTQAGSFFKACVVLLGACVCAGALRWVPRAALAAVILAAMASLVEFAPLKLWKHCKGEVLVYVVTLVLGVSVGLEAGVAGGAAVDAFRLLVAHVKPQLEVHSFVVGRSSCSRVTFAGALRGAGAARVARRVRGVAGDVVVLDGRHLYAMDLGVAESVISASLDIESEGRRMLLWNFSSSILGLLDALTPEYSSRAVRGASIDAYVLGLGDHHRRSSIPALFNDLT